MTVKIIYDEVQEIGVPESSITIQGETAFVYLVNGEIAEKKTIKIDGSIFYRFWLHLGNQVGAMLATFSVRRGAGKIAPSSLLRSFLFFFDFFTFLTTSLPLPHVSSILEGLWLHLGAKLAPC